MRLLCVSALGLTLGLSSAGAAEVAVLTSLPAQHVLQQLTPKFESAGHQLKPTYSGTLDTRERMAANQLFDVVIGARPELDRFAKEGKLVEGTLTNFMVSRIGIAVRPGSPKPALTEDGVKEALLKAKAVGYSTGSSGEHLTKTILPKLGIADQVKSKLKQVPSGESSGKLVASGEADIAIQQVSELIHFPGVDYVGPLPEQLQADTTYAAGVHAKAKDPEAAKALIRLLASPDAAPIIKEEGMTPSS